MIDIRKPIDYEAVAAFIADMNKDQQNHVGYCGTKADEVLHTLQNDFSDLPLEKSLITTYENDQLIGVIGLDIDEDTKAGELWGPFVMHRDWEQISRLMWEKLITQLPHGSLSSVLGFYNQHNERCESFMEKLGAKRDERENTILKITRSEYCTTIEEEGLIREYVHDDFESFKALHHDAFKQPYYNADDIIKKLDHENKLFIAADQVKMLGYVYCETNPTFSEGDIHFIAVSPAARNKGIGRKLISKSLDFMFSFKELEEIILCVDSSNQPAIKIYKSVGFTQLHELISYELSLKNVLI